MGKEKDLILHSNVKSIVRLNNLLMFGETSTEMANVYDTFILTCGAQCFNTLPHFAYEQRKVLRPFQHFDTSNGEFPDFVMFLT